MLFVWFLESFGNLCDVLDPTQILLAISKLHRMHLMYIRLMHLIHILLQSTNTLPDPGRLNIILLPDLTTQPLIPLHHLNSQMPHYFLTLLCYYLPQTTIWEPLPAFLIFILYNLFFTSTPRLRFTQLSALAVVGVVLVISVQEGQVFWWFFH